MDFLFERAESIMGLMSLLANASSCNFKKKKKRTLENIFHTQNETNNQQEKPLGNN